MLSYNDKSYQGLSVYYQLNSVFRKIELVFFVLASIILILASSKNSEMTDKISEFFVDISLPVVEFGSRPFNSMIDIATNFEELANARKQNKILQAENEQLRSVYIRAIDIKRENAELRGLLNFIEVNSVKYKSTKLIAGANSLYGSNVFIAGGKNDNIKEDSVVVGSKAMLGRITNVGNDKSKVMLLTDINSHIPVISSETGNRGILMGNNSGVMEIHYLAKNHNIKKGELIFTSGDDGYLPSGLLVGVVSKSNLHSVSVKMAENINNTNLVSVIEY